MIVLFNVLFMIVNMVFASMNPDLGWIPETVIQSKQIVKLINKERILQDADLGTINFDYTFQAYLHEYVNHDKLHYASWKLLDYKEGTVNKEIINYFE